MYFDNDDIKASEDCFKCKHNNNCYHSEGLYLTEMDSCWAVCNECGLVVYHGPKKQVEDFLYQKQNQLEFDFS